jgi:glycosyltransferase involved in cell wall biosynthesis
VTPLVSILIPAFNAQQWIADAIRSAVGQTWSRTEVIVVDDGSTDKTLRVARSFESDRVLVLTQENSGAAAARNRALAAAQGDVIQWLDADDLLDPRKVERQMEVALRIDCARTLLSGAWGRFWHRPDHAEFAPTALWADLAPVEWLLLKLGHNLYMQTASWLVSRALTDAAGPWNTTLLGDDDGEYFCRVLLASDGVRFVPDSRMFYRISCGHNLSDVGASDSKMEAHFRSLYLHIQYLLSREDSERTRAACVTYLQNSLIHVFPERPDIVRQAEDLAAALGGRLEPPHLGPKYSLLTTVLGMTAAKRIQHASQYAKWSLVRYWDRTLLGLENRSRG